MSSMRILVVGTWNEITARKFHSQAVELGSILAQRDHSLVASPSTGFQGLVAQAYKAAGGRNFIGFYPDLDIMTQIGEGVLVEPDKKIMTGECYPIRNMLQVKGSHAIIAITGGAGTLTELLTGVNDYDLPASYLRGSSSILDGYLQLDSVFATKVYASQTISSLVEYLENSGAGKK
jgi:predicted Rossmann-fold nucleotide-binding protein